MNLLTAHLVLEGAQVRLEEKFGADVTICTGLYESSIEAAERIVSEQPVTISIMGLGIRDIMLKKVGSTHRITVVKKSPSLDEIREEVERRGL